MKNKKSLLTTVISLVVLAVAGLIFGDDAVEKISDSSSYEISTSVSEEYSVTEESEESESSDEEVEVSEMQTSAVTEQTASLETEVLTETDNDVILEKGSYTTPEDVAEYIHTFGTLPDNFITKNEAEALGWVASEGNLWDVADGMSIGGDRFGNYEKILPDADGRKWTECDVNYTGGFRGGERIVFSNDGLIFYTNDHYETFVQLY